MRDDIHRPSTLVPADYEQHVDYDLGNYPMPAFGVDCTMPVPTYDAEGRPTGYYVGKHGTGDRCCLTRAEDVARAEGRKIFGARGKCGVCGAHFRYGTMFRHVAGDLVHMGHDCADKYELMYDSSATELEQGRRERALATVIRRAENDIERAEFLAANPGLEVDLAVSHPIIADIAAKFVTYRSLSEKQVALVRKLADEVRNPKPAEEQERHAVAPTGKGIEFEGVIVGAKLRVSEQWGASWKVTVKVTNDDGAVWLAWGTAPKMLLDVAVAMATAAEDADRAAWVARATAARDAGEDLPASPARKDRGEYVREALRGMHVEVKATLERPNPREIDTEYMSDSTIATIRQRNAETHFVMMQRPSVYPVRYSHPIKSAKRIKAEADFAKAVYNERIAMREAFTKSGGDYYKTFTDVEATTSLAARGITLDGMIAATLAPKARKAKAPTVTQVGEAFALAMAGL